MKKIGSILVIFVLLLVVSCKKSSEAVAGIYSITSGSATVGWPPFGNAYFAMRADVSCQNEVAGTIISWKFLFKTDERVIVEVDNLNYTAYAPYIQTNAGYDEQGRFYIPAGRDIFFKLSQSSGGEDFFCPYYMLPERPYDLLIVMEILDENGNLAACEYKTFVDFSFMDS